MLVNDFLFIYILPPYLLSLNMAALILTILLLSDYSVLSLAQSVPEPLQVAASDTVYGPDGPWQAVSVQLGSPGQKLDLYPGGVFQSNILTNQICQDITATPCGSGGLFIPENSETIDDTSISFGSGNAGSSSFWTNGAMLLSYSDTTSIRDQLHIAGNTVANFDATMIPNITTQYPDGSYPLQVGELSLGPSTNQTFTVGDSTNSINASLIPGSLVAKKIIPSNSFGLHIGIGAEALKLDLSLWLGGYDASRIVGPVSSQSLKNDPGSEFVIDLLDIGIGVDHGGSPFPYSSQGGLLSSGNSSVSSAGISVYMNPSAPYLSLPNSTCAAIAKDLPVTYNAGKALYFWDVADPQYAKIVTTPTYLSFVFGGSSGNLTINTPFQLLNLTLQAPLTSTPTPYFPCQPPQGDSGTYSLGRSFLQSAFIGVSWIDQGVGQWYLAQAPGPKTDSNPQSKPLTSDSQPRGLGNTWADTWDGFWTALPASTVGPTPTKPANSVPTSAPPTHGLSGGTIAGIAIGGVCAVVITLGIGFLLFRRRKGGTPKAPPFPVEEDGGNTQGLPHQPPHYWHPKDNPVGKTPSEEPIRELPEL